MEWFSKFLGWLFSLVYSINGNYLAALILFTLLTKIILLPLSIIVHKNSIKLVKLTPDINNIKYSCYGDKDLINTKTLELYKKEKYNPLVSVFPLIVQLILLMGVIEVVSTPEYSGLTVSDMLSCGIDFSLVSKDVGGLYYLFPIIAAVSSMIMCITQNISQALQAEQSKLNKYGMMALSTALSLYLGFFVSAGVAAYWILSNLMSIAQMYILNAVISPKKYIDYAALEESKKKLEAIEGSEKSMDRELKKRQHDDYKRFFSIANKHVVFYSEQSGFYKYFKGLIEYLISHSNITIHYVTSDPNDVIFDIAKEQKQIKPYFIGENKLISLFLKMDAKIVVMTMPDLDNFHIKRSYVSSDVEYIYMDHGLSSINMLARKGAVDHFDTVFCAGQHIIDEMKATEEHYGLPHKNLIAYGYGFMDGLIKTCSTDPTIASGDFILLAPSHQKDNILDSCLEPVIGGLKSTGYKVILRPHPQYIRRYPDKWKRISAQYSSDPQVITESDFSSNTSIYQAALVVTDWSNIGYEYSFSTLRPVMFVNTPMKVINPDYKEIGVVPIDLSLRSEIGIEVTGKSADEVADAAEKLLKTKCFSAEQISEVRDRSLFNVGKSDEVGGKYILSRLSQKK